MSERLKSAATALVLAAMALAMAGWTWGTWSDVVVDFGRELYIAWQITEGRALYVDVASFNGPLSPHINALWFRLLGLSIRSLVIGNLVILSGFLVILYSVFRSVADRLSAAVVTAFFIVVFAFGEYYDVRNYNYVTPYAHEIVHGVLLSLAAIRCVIWFAASGRIAAAWAIGLLLGLTALTKPEVFVSAAAAVLVGFTLILWRLDRRDSPLFPLLALVSGASVPIGVAWLLLGRTMPLAAAAAALIRPYRFLLDPAVSSLPFYARMTGLDRPGAALAAIGRATLAYAVLVAGLTAVAFAAKGLRTRTEITALAGLAVFITGFLGRAAIVAEVARPLPVLMVAATVVLGRLVMRHDSPGTRHHIARLTLVLFAGALLTKIALNARLYQYGFALAMPAALLVVTALIGWIPAYLDGRGADGRTFRSVAGVAVGTVALVFLTVHRERIAQSVHPVGAGRDRILADDRAMPMNAMARIVTERARDGDRLVVIPEGALLNYLTRRSGSTPYAAFMPPEFAMFGEDRIERTLRDNPPEYIVMVDRPMNEYGSEGFGVDYGQGIRTWIETDYTLEMAVPGVPNMTHDFGMRLFRRSGMPQTHATR